MRDKDQLLVHAPETVCQGREPIFFHKLNMETECNSMICNAQPAFYRFPPNSICQNDNIYSGPIISKNL